MSPTYSVCKDHGYIAGEHFECPECGGKTEVYSRITGYYRPVQNWNDGKSQEYKHRKVYDIENSKLTHGAPDMEVTAAAEESCVKDGTYLFTTATCPNCKIAKSLLDKAGVVYEALLANEHADMATAFGIKTAPTLVVVKNGEVHKCAGVSDIKKMLNQ
jgi:ribonucleoside-triphosphate reductase